MINDICYIVNPSNKDDCYRKMVKDIDSMPYKDMNKTAILARTIINRKQQLGLGVKKIDTNKEFANELHKRIINKFPRRHVCLLDFDAIWTANVIIFSNYAKYDNCYKYIMTVVNLFTKHG